MTDETTTLMEEEQTEQQDALEMQAALAKVDLSVPTSYEVDLMASELVNYLALYLKMETARKAARQNKDDKRAETMRMDAVYARTAAAFIQYKFPGAKAIADQIMEAEAKAAQVRRTKALALESGK